jgi:hypothetical protein
MTCLTRNFVEYILQNPASRNERGIYLIHCIARQFQALVHLRLYRSKTDGRVKDQSGRLGHNRNLPKSVVSIYDNDDKTNF